MFGSLDLSQLQELWWGIISLLGGLFLFLTFVQGGQTLLMFGPVAENENERILVINSLGRKWELTFTTLVLLGGALFAAFPKFYATSFGGAYWVWVAILFTFILQAVSYEFRRKPGNLLGTRVYDFFLFINGSLGLLLIGAAIGTFFTGANFSLNAYNQVTWHHPLRGLEAAFDPFNVAMGLMLVFLARILGAMYLSNNIKVHNIHANCCMAAYKNMLLMMPCVFYIMYQLVTMQGFALSPETGLIWQQNYKYVYNLNHPMSTTIMFTGGFLLILWAVLIARYYGSRNSIWYAGIGTVMMGFHLFFIAGTNNTSFYPSKINMQDSLTIYNASSSHYTLTAMSYVALAVPLVLAYIIYVWRAMDAVQLSEDDLKDADLKKFY